MKKILMALVLMPIMVLAGSDLYMVVDLSGGATATKYPISFLSDVPEGGWSDEYKTTKLVLRRIEPGTCVVTVDKPYYAGVFEVTQKQYELIMGTNPSHFSGNDKRPVEQVSYDMIRGNNKGAQYPSSTDVDDDSFMGKMRARTGLHFDLPTDAQWEYACRADTTTAYSYGDSANGDYMWYSANSDSYTHDVGSRKSNEWGIYDMHGNLWEWCLGWHPNYTSHREDRGGSWGVDAKYCVSSSRGHSDPSTAENYLGFRLFCSAPVVITDVKAQQRYPWNGKVDISYFATGIETKAKEEGLLVSLKVAAIDQDAGTTNVATTLSGDISLADGTHKIVWDMNAQGLDIKSTNVVFVVSYVDPLYCVIDLAGGTLATNYPVSYLADVPAGGWSDEYKTTKLVLRRIKASTFTMGSPTDECGRNNGETQHQVTLTKGYWMGVFQVTQRQWELVMGTRPSYFNNNACYASRPVEQVSYDMIRGSSAGAGWPNSSDVDATSFLGALQVKSGLALDLPTEAQWEYACRAGTTTALNSGKNLTGEYQGAEMDKVGRYYYNSGQSYSPSTASDLSAGTAKVGSYAPNDWGLCDMHGNVFEWCLDWYGPYSGDVTDPKGSSAGLSRVVRGGSWYDEASYCRSALRSCKFPSYEDGYGYGFRLVGILSDDTLVPCESNPVLIDLTTGTRIAAKTEVLTYSTNWVENVGLDAVAEVSVEGAIISTESGSGTVEWMPKTNGTYHFTHTIKTNGEVVGEVLTATFIAEGLNPEAPVIYPASGTTFGSSLSVSMKCASEGATIHYTTDGTTPTMESATYKKFKIYGKTTVKAIAFYEDGTPSDMAVAEYSKGYCATPVVMSQAEFTGSKQRVDIVCETKGATVYYTTDGTDPDLQSPIYTKPFYVTDTTTVKAYATKADYTNSDIAALTITKVWGIGDTMGKPDHTFETSGAKGFVRVEDETATLGESMKSGAIGDSEKSILSTTVVGPGTLTFKWKASCEEDDEYEWDHGEFRVNGGTPKGWINGVTDWIEVSQRINGKGTNTVTWTYVKDDVESVEDDCIWVSDYAWKSDYTETQTTEVPVPYDWLKAKSRDIVDEYENYEKVAKQAAYNKRLTVEQCYVTGVNPESATNDFISVIKMVDGVPVVTWEPDLGAARAYKIWGSENLRDWQWPTNAHHRFFKVTVEMPK